MSHTIKATKQQIVEAINAACGGTLNAQLKTYFDWMLSAASEDVVEHFITTVRFPGGRDDAIRFLLSSAMRDVSVEQFVALTGVSTSVGKILLSWLGSDTTTTIGKSDANQQRR